MTRCLFDSRVPSRLALALLLGFSSVAILASPGAHGPNGEHLDAPGASQSLGGSAPRFEAKSEDFELVGRLQGGELSMFINRFATSEPVDNAKVELELGSLKAPAPFHADQGDYAVADDAFLKALSRPGDHALVITLVAGNDSDLLEGTLSVPAASPFAAGDHAHGGWRRIAGIGAAMLVSLGVVWLLIRRRSARASQKGVA